MSRKYQEVQGTPGYYDCPVCNRCGSKETDCTCPPLKIIDAGKYVNVGDYKNCERKLKGLPNSVLIHDETGNPVKWADGSDKHPIKLPELAGPGNRAIVNLIGQTADGQVVRKDLSKCGEPEVVTVEDGEVTTTPITNITADVDWASIQKDCGYEGHCFLAIKQVTSSRVIPVKASPFIAGMAMPWFGPKNTIPDGWKIADGSPYDKDKYPYLFARFGYGPGRFGEFPRLPDIRDRVVRGVTDGAETNQDFNSRTNLYEGGNTGNSVATYQDDAFQCHKHGLTASDVPTSSSTPVSFATRTTSFSVRPAEQGAYITYVSQVTGGEVTNGIAEITVDMGGMEASGCGELRTASENRGKNINAYWIIYMGCAVCEPTDDC